MGPETHGFLMNTWYVAAWDHELAGGKLLARTLLDKPVLLYRGDSGRMVALQNGQYTTVPVDTCTQGLKRVDVGELYDSEEYRPKVRHVLGKPMFLY